MRSIFFVLLFVSLCCIHLHFMLIAISNHCEICQMFFHLCFTGVSEINYLTWKQSRTTERVNMNIYITVIIFLLVCLLGNCNSGVSDDRPLLSEP